MFITTFFVVLVSLWLAVTMTALCPVRALRQRRQERELEDWDC